MGHKLKHSSCLRKHDKSSLYDSQKSYSLACFPAGAKISALPPYVVGKLMAVPSLLLLLSPDGEASVIHCFPSSQSSALLQSVGPRQGPALTACQTVKSRH